MSVIGSLFYGLANLLHPRMLWLMIWPMLVSLALWGAVALAFWRRLAAALAGLFQRWLEPEGRLRALRLRRRHGDRS